MLTITVFLEPPSRETLRFSKGIPGDKLLSEHDFVPNGGCLLSVKCFQNMRSLKIREYHSDNHQF